MQLAHQPGPAKMLYRIHAGQVRCFPLYVGCFSNKAGYVVCGSMYYLTQAANVLLMIWLIFTDKVELRT